MHRDCEKVNHENYEIYDNYKNFASIQYTKLKPFSRPFKWYLVHPVLIGYVKN